MPRPSARQHLVELLEGAELDECRVRELMLLPYEGQYLEFKSGEVTRDKATFRSVLREYTSAFANADGGILVVGVSDGDTENDIPREITETSRPGGQPLHEWARNVLQGLAPRLYPPPTIKTLAIDGKEVLVVATARSPNLVPCVKEHKLVYYLRLCDATVLVPDYLVTDLLLGRRSHPVLNVTSARAASSDQQNGGMSVVFAFDLENEGLMPARDVEVGVVAWSVLPSSASVHSPQRRAAPATRHLRTLVDARRPYDRGTKWELMHVTSLRQETAPISIAPFAMQPVSGVGDIVVPRVPVVVPMKTALYVMAGEHPPSWYQLTVNFEVDKAEARLERLWDSRPLVAWGGAAGLPVQ